MQRYPMTPEGKVALEKELQQLKQWIAHVLSKRLQKLVSTVI